MQLSAKEETDLAGSAVRDVADNVDVAGCAATQRMSSVDRIDNPVTTSQAGEQRDASLSRIDGHNGCPPTEEQVWRRD
ncbi:hypothetical protein B4U45_16310 [Mycobacterium persicum]|uniref:Uncharacterized protein n=1 Tax=Mycobacterium persicum TaxID=1487726 RepID=A0A8E2LMY7_9MYCO|nr:hypothetical protein A4G31_15170 [Mycobacterium persicum]ORB50102.1 hypothetical protein BST40_11965 [Mycobacterium persicum]ORB95903.1 hypothetical protein B1T44_16975 [Mycobacterium persicum]ORC07926.1 hypothetical protein B4U45_16310 [Mycobacterium persicum]